jgi:hypothetical protein
MFRLLILKSIKNLLLYKTYNNQKATFNSFYLTTFRLIFIFISTFVIQKLHKDAQDDYLSLFLK